MQKLKCSLGKVCRNLKSERSQIRAWKVTLTEDSGVQSLTSKMVKGCFGTCVARFYCRPSLTSVSSQLECCGQTFGTAQCLMKITAQTKAAFPYNKPTEASGYRFSLA